MNRPAILDLQEIIERVDVPRLLEELAEGFVAFSAGRVTMPPVGYLALSSPPGEVHVKFGYADGDGSYVVKIASGFSENPARGLPAGDGVVLCFDRVTGALTTVLLDRGYLTDLRTAAAGALVARTLGPSRVGCIGILGTGRQARLQLALLADVTPCRQVLVWGRNHGRLAACAQEMRQLGFEVGTASSPQEVASSCELIVTATAAREPLLRAAWMRPGTHVTAVGADAPGKTEIEAAVLRSAHRVVADSVSQCLDHGEIGNAVRAGALDPERVVELGDVLGGRAAGRQHDDELTLCDLTGLAIQDIVAARHVTRLAAGRTPAAASPFLLDAPRGG